MDCDRFEEQFDRAQESKIARRAKKAKTSNQLENMARRSQLNGEKQLREKSREVSRKSKHHVCTTVHDNLDKYNSVAPQWSCINAFEDEQNHIYPYTDPYEVYDIFGDSSTWISLEQILFAQKVFMSIQLAEKVV